MRKAEREITDWKEILQILEECKVCRLAFHDEPYPYVIPLSFGYLYENNNFTLYFHCANEGKKLDLMKSDNHVSFEIDNLVNLIVKEPSCQSTMEYDSVCGVGLLRVAKDEEKENALNCIMNHYSINRVHSFDQTITNRTTVLVLQVNDITGKQLRQKPK